MAGAPSGVNRHSRIPHPQDIGVWLETRITALGGKFECAEGLMKPHVVVDGKLYTGQNPASAKPLAERIVKDLNKQ